VYLIPHATPRPSAVFTTWISNNFSSKNLFLKPLLPKENDLLEALQNPPPLTQNPPRKPPSSSGKRPLDTACEKTDSLVPATVQTTSQPTAPAPKKPRLSTQPETRAPPAGQSCQSEVPKRVTRSAMWAAEARKFKTGTVWDSIRMTDSMYKGTRIPKSFEISVGSQKFWVHPNATDHMWEYITKSRPITHSMPINSQTILTSFKAAMEEAISKGFKYEEVFTIGCWQFKIGKARKSGFLPTIYHAQFVPKGFG